MVLVQVAAGIMGSSVVKYGFNFFLFFARDSEVFVVWIGKLCSSSCKLNKYSYALKLDHRNFKALKQFDIRTHLINSSIAMVLSSISMVQPFGNEITNPGLNCTIVSVHCLFITWIFISVIYWYVCTRNVILGACIIYLFIYLSCVYI